MMRATIAALAALLLPAALGAQVVKPGAARVQMSDATGPSVASLVRFEVGTTRMFSCPVAWGIRTTADQLAMELDAGTLRVSTATGSQLQPAPAAQRRVFRLLAGGPEAGAARQSVVVALSAPRSIAANGNGNGNAASASPAASALVRELDGLFVPAQAMDPARPGHRTAVTLSHAIYAFNVFTETLDAAYRGNPPDEFIVIETVLSRMVVAAFDNADRAVSTASRRGDYGLACAPPPVAATPAPPPPPPVERAIEVCVLDGARIRYVPAVLLPETGDTLVIIAGSRRPFSTVYPDQGYAGELEWVREGASVQVGRSQFMPYGVPFVVAPDAELVHFATHLGVPLFVPRGSPTPPKQILLPLAPRCVVQPYLLLEDIRKKQ